MAREEIITLRVVGPFEGEHKIRTTGKSPLEKVVKQISEIYDLSMESLAVYFDNKRIDLEINGRKATPSDYDMVDNDYIDIV